MKTHIIMFAILVMSQAFVFNLAPARTYDPAPPPVNVVNNTTEIDNGDARDYTPGAAIAAASGLCVKDWKPGWQKCVSWSMLNVEGADVVHGFGGGVTTRIDQFSVHLYGGLEDLEGDNTTVMFGGSLNWR